MTDIEMEGPPDQIRDDREQSELAAKQAKTEIPNLVIASFAAGAFAASGIILALGGTPSLSGGDIDATGARPR